MYILCNCYDYSYDGEKGFKSSEEIIGFDVDKERLKTRWNANIKSCPEMVGELIKTNNIHNPPIFGEEDYIVYRETHGRGNNTQQMLRIKQIISFDEENYAGFGDIFVRCANDKKLQQDWVEKFRNHVERVREWNLQSCY